MAKKACKIVLASLTEGRCAVPKPLNWLSFRCVRTTPPGAVEKLLHISNFLVPLSVAESCKYRGVDFLDFLRSGETDIATFALPRRNGE
jgi:hypothetical protein